MNPNMRILLFTLLIFLLISCRNRQENQVVRSPDPETLIQINQYLVKEDAERIRAFGERQNWNLTQTDDGLWYQVIDKGESKRPQSGDTVSYNYSISFLDGRKVYSSDSMGLKTFIVDQSQVESGWHTISTLINEGDSVRMVLPPHLAFGLAGDGDKVPPRTILIYQLKLVKIQ